MTDNAGELLTEALPGVMSRLFKLAAGDDNKAARRAVGMLLRYFSSEKAVQLSLGLGPDAAQMHVTALNFLLGRQAELEAGGKGKGRGRTTTKH